MTRPIVSTKTSAVEAEGRLPKNFGISQLCSDSVILCSDHLDLTDLPNLTDLLELLDLPDYPYFLNLSDNLDLLDSIDLATLYQTIHDFTA